MTLDEIYENLVEIQTKALQTIAWINKIKEKQGNIQIDQPAFQKPSKENFEECIQMQKTRKTR